MGKMIVIGSLIFPLTTLGNIVNTSGMATSMIAKLLLRKCSYIAS